MGKCVTVKLKVSTAMKYYAQVFYHLYVHAGTVTILFVFAWLL